MSERTDRFLNLYRTLEEVLLDKYQPDDRRHASVVMDFLADPDSMPFRDDLNLCREIRNILSHRAEMDGEAVIEPAQALIDTLGDIVEYAKKPPMAIQCATKAKDILLTTMDSLALPLMRAMEEKGYSHIPVIGNDQQFIGVFSKSSVFSYMLEWKEPRLNEQTTVHNFRKFLPIDRHNSEQFQFMDESATVLDVRYAFEKQKERSRRLAAVFITKTGAPEEPLLGMVTPWDVLENKAKENAQ